VLPKNDVDKEMWTYYTCIFKFWHGSRWFVSQLILGSLLRYIPFSLP
jgi:hypothetical protein